MPQGVIATIPEFQFSANGVPMVGGTLDTYIAGTTTPTTTWQDSALTVANTNPITLDARGECVLWLDSAVVYKFVLKNSSGVVQWTQDNISNPVQLLKTDLAASSGASLVAGGVAMQRDAIVTINTTGMPDGSVIIAKGRDTAGDGGGGTFRYSAASVQPADGGTVFAPTGGGRLLRDGWTVFGYNGGVSVAWFGVKGDNATNDSPAMALAIVAQESMRCELLVPAKAKIRIVTTLDMPPCLRITGVGAAGHMAPAFIAVAGVAIFTCRDGFGTEQGAFSNLVFDSDTPGMGRAFLGNPTRYISTITWRNVMFTSNLRFGIDAPIILNSFYDCDFGSYPGITQNFTAISSNGTVGSYEPNANSFFKCTFRKSNAPSQIETSGAPTQWNFYACDFEQNACTEQIIRYDGAGSVSFFGGYIESNNTPYFLRIYGDLAIAFSQVVRLHGVHVLSPATVAILKRELPYPVFDIQDCYGQLNCNVTQNELGQFNQALDLENCYGNFFVEGTGSHGELSTVSTTGGYNARRIKVKKLESDQLNAVQKLGVSVTAATTICTLSNPLLAAGANWSGQVAVTAVSGPSLTGGAANTASYLLNIANGGLVACDLVKASGVTTGGAAAHPSFSWTTNAGGALIATPIASTTGVFSFLVSCTGMVKAA